MMRLPRLHAAIGIVAAAVLSLPPAARAAEPDRVAEALARARADYESGMQALRDDILRGINAKIDAAGRGTEGGPEKVKAAAEELREFQRSGAWPALANADALRQREAKIADHMNKAFARAMADYATAGRDGLLASVTLEADEFQSQSDLVPWRDVLAPPAAREARRIAPGAEPLSVDVGSADEYRLEILARRSGDAGVLVLEFPITGGKRFSTRATPGSSGDLRILLTVSEGMVAADLGLQRPIGLGTAEDGEARDLRLTADGGEFIIERVRTKPVLRGGRAEVAANQSHRDPPGRSKTAGGGATLLRPGASGQGDWTNERGKTPARATVTVLERDGDKVVFRVVKNATGETMRVECKLSGDRMTVKAVEQTAPPRGAPRFRVVETESGSGSIRDGTLSLSWTVRGHSRGGAANRPWRVHLRNIKMN